MLLLEKEKMERAISEAVPRVLGGISVHVHASGKPHVPPPDRRASAHTRTMYHATARQAFSANAILACVGESAFAEKPGDISELELPQGISAFVKDLRKVSDDRTPIILALLEGRPRILRDIPRTVRLGFGQACHKGSLTLVALGTYNHGLERIVKLYHTSIDSNR